MRYFEIYRNCCVVKHDKEMSKEDFEAVMWAEAYEIAYQELVADGAITPWDELDRPYESEEDNGKLDDRAEIVYDRIVKEAEGSRYNGAGNFYLSGDFYIYVRDDDTDIYDMKSRRPN